MTLLYFFETSLEYHGMTSKQLYQLWLKHAGAAFKLYEQGIMKYAFKVGPLRDVPHWDFWELRWYFITP